MWKPKYQKLDKVGEICYTIGMSIWRKIAIAFHDALDFSEASIDEPAFMQQSIAEAFEEDRRNIWGDWHRAFAQITAGLGMK